MNKHQLLRSGVTLEVHYDNLPDGIPDNIADEGQSLVLQLNPVLGWVISPEKTIEPLPSSGKVSIFPMNDHIGSVLTFMVMFDHDENTRSGGTIAVPLEVAEQIGKRITVLCELAKNGRRP